MPKKSKCLRHKYGIKNKCMWLCNKVCQWFSPGTPVSSTNKADFHDIAIIVKSGIKHLNPNQNVAGSASIMT